MRKPWLRHVIVAGAVVVLIVLGGTGVIGATIRSRILHWQVVVTPRPAGGFEVRQWIDIDHRNDRSEGWELTFDDRFGAVQDVVVRAPESANTKAPDVAADGNNTDPQTTSSGSGTADVRIGDLGQSPAGVYRYEVDYSLPETPSQPGDDLVIELPVDRSVSVDSLDVALVGIELDGPSCTVHSPNRTRFCLLNRRPEGGYTIDAPGVAAHNTVRVEGVIVDTFEQSSPRIAPPRRPYPYPYRNEWPVGLGLGGACLLGVSVVDRLRGRRRNPAVGDTKPAVLNVASHKSANGRRNGRPMAAPPPHIAPWEARVLLTERFDSAEVYSAYLAGLVGQSAVTLRPEASSLAIRPGPRLSDAATDDRRNIDAIIAASKQTTRAHPQPIEMVRDQVIDDLSRRLDTRDWWSRGTPAPTRPWRSSLRGSQRRYTLAAAASLVVASLLVVAARNSFYGIFAASFVFGAVLGLIVYGGARPERTRAGTSAAHHTESFRRYLRSATASDVDDAIRAGVAREYSGWAVGLGETAAWSTAVDEAAHARPSVADEVREPLLVASRT